MTPIISRFSIPFLILLTACGGLNSSVQQSLFGPAWELEYLSGPQIAVEGLFPETKPYISFDMESGQVMGNSGCNGYRAPYELNGQKIKFGEPGPSTLMYCGEGENHFRTIMRKVDTWRITKDGKLEFLLADVPMMRFHKRSGA